MEFGNECKEEKYIKCINFDLDTKQLKEKFPDSTRLPYSMIRKFFEDRGFAHRQYSGYISKEPLDHYDIAGILEELGNNFTWLNTCIQKFDVSNAPITIDMRDTIIKSANKKLKELSISNNAKQNITKSPKPKSRKR